MARARVHDAPVGPRRCACALRASLPRDVCAPARGDRLRLAPPRDGRCRDGRADLRAAEGTSGHVGSRRPRSRRDAPSRRAWSGGFRRAGAEHDGPAVGPRSPATGRTPPRGRRPGYRGRADGARAVGRTRACRGLRRRWRRCRRRPALRESGRPAVGARDDATRAGRRAGRACACRASAHAGYR